MQVGREVGPGQQQLGGEDVDSVIIVGDKRVDKVLRKCRIQKVDSHGLYLMSEIKII